MREIIADSLCNNAGFEILNRRDDFWILGDQKQNDKAFEIFYIAEIDAESGENAVEEVFRKLKQMDAASATDVRLHLMIITDRAIPDSLERDDSIFDFLWIINTEEKYMKLIISESLKMSNREFIISNKLNMLKNLLEETIAQDSNGWQIL